MNERDDLAVRFETERPRLRAIAAKLLGSAADADDAVQETWLRLERADATDIENLGAWLTTVVSRVCLDTLRAPRRAREHSWQVEPWRDEPIAADADPADLVDRGRCRPGRPRRSRRSSERRTARRPRDAQPRRAHRLRVA